jgi:micrococcal nuclease
MYEYNFELVKVVDGDTVDIDIDLGFGIWMRNERIRIMGIDTPESRTSDKEEKKFGLLAKQQVITYMATAAQFISHKDEKGKYGRKLGDFQIYHTTSGAWMSMAAAMIRDNHGVKYHGQNKEDIAEEHLRNREHLARRGLVPDEDGSVADEAKVAKEMAAQVALRDPTTLNYSKSST